MRAILYAEGFGAYPSISDEIAAIEGGYWSPTSVDFAYTGGARSRGIDSFGRLLAWISTKRPRTIDSIALIGHGGQGKFAFAGRVIPNLPGGVEFSSSLFVVTLLEHLAQIHALRERFREEASITFYSCNTGSDRKFLKDVASTFGVTARGFSTPIYWCVGFNYRRTEIEGRGRTTRSQCPGRRGILHLTPNMTESP